MAVGGTSSGAPRALRAMPGPARAVPAIIAPLRRKLRRLSRCFGSVAMLPLLATRRESGVPSALPHGTPGGPPQKRLNALPATRPTTISPTTTAPVFSWAHIPVVALHAAFAHITDISLTSFSGSGRCASRRERIGTKLELHDLARRSLAALDMEGRSGAVGRPQSLALPASIRIVDAPIHPLRVEAHGIRDAKGDELPVHEGQQRLVGVTGGDGHVRTQAERIVLIDPGVIGGLGAAGIRHRLELWPGERMERPAFGTVLPGRGGAVERPLAPSTVEAREMSARQRRPDDAAPIDVHAARPVSRQWRLEHFRQRGRRRIRSRIEPNDVTRETQHGAPK